MRKLFTLSLLALLFAACSDDDGPSVDMNQLTRKWYPVSANYEGVEFPYEHGECAKDYLEFFADLTDKFVEHDECTPYIDEGTYTVSGNTITRTDEWGDPTTVTVTRLTATEFVIEGSDTFEGETIQFTERYVSNLN